MCNIIIFVKGEIDKDSLTMSNKISVQKSSSLFRLVRGSGVNEGISRPVVLLRLLCLWLNAHVGIECGTSVCIAVRRKGRSIARVAVGDGKKGC